MKIITPVVNNPDFIRAQHHTLKNYINIEYEFIVFNDAKQFPDYTNFGDPSVWSQIVNVCKELDIQCINIPNDHHRELTHTGMRHIQSMEFITQYMFNNPDKYFHIDSDMFLVHTFDLTKFDNYDCAIISQQRPGLDYVWPNLFWFDITKLKYKEHVNWNLAANTDTGGMMAQWLELYRKTDPNSIYYIQGLGSCRWSDTQFPPYIANRALPEFLKGDPRNTNDGKFWCELFDGAILHYRAGSNWNGEGENVHKYITAKLMNVLMD